MGLPRGALNGCRASTGGEEGNSWDVEFSEDFGGPAHHDIEDGANGLGSGSGGEEVLKRKGDLFMVFTVVVDGVRGRGRGRLWWWWWWWSGGWDFEDLDVRVLAERGGDGGGEIGGDDECGLEVSRSYVFA